MLDVVSAYVCILSTALEAGLSTQLQVPNATAPLSMWVLKKAQDPVSCDLSLEVQGVA